ncbi:hypothetical protein [Streptomyces sp. NPDC005548]|uniref:hypothetical protein n=1 Tax=Streptomyces sp. NPDC005548 TaxID=3364724 RepID=UPI003698D009
MGEDGLEREIVDQYALALAAAGVGDGRVVFNCRAAVLFVRSSGRRLWAVQVEDADRYLVWLRKEGDGNGRPIPMATGSLVLLRGRGDEGGATDEVAPRPALGIDADRTV